MKSIKTNTILSKHKYKNMWFNIDYIMNLYRGCCHGCIYCDARSDCYQITDFDQVTVKENAISILEKELKATRNKGIIGIGSMSDTYNPFEKNQTITRQALLLLARYGFGVSLVTKSDLIVRDIDVLKEIQKHAPIICKLTITTIDDTLSKKIEPNVCCSSNRFNALEKLTSEGIFSGIMLMPILPYITDNEQQIISLIRRAHECGARFIYPAFGMTLRANQRDYYYEQLDRIFPNLKEKYVQQYGDAYNCQAENSKKLYHIFVSECQKTGLLFQMKDIIAAYMQHTPQQLKLF
ncbi:MAG: radical SAM protein [Lentimicrobiaceae bacterium]|jgi:DNA repair photolyase|nr:radical SAM protein [Lentimicrobiaceae bacterium]